jgi:hypothetical protein
LYVALNRQGKILSIIAFAMFLAESIILAISKLGAYALITLSQEYIRQGSPEASQFTLLGDFFLKNIYNTGYDIHNLFFCFGAIIWYYLVLKSRYIPRAISLWGLVSVSLVLINTIFMIYDPRIGRIYPMLIPYIPFEAVNGVLLIVRGFNLEAAKRKTIDPI